MKTLGVCIAALGLAGCASIGGDPMINAIAAPDLPVACGSGEHPTPTEASDADLCNTLTSIRSTASAYHGVAEQLNRAHVSYGLVQTASAVALLGFGMFDAHPDNSSAATLVGAVATGARQGVRPERQRDILIDGMRSMRCVAERGAVFMGQRRTIAPLRASVSQAAQLAAQARGQAEAADAAEQAQADAVLAAVGELESTITSVRETIGYRERAVLQVQEGRNRVESAVLTQLRADRPDYAAIIAAIRAGAAPAPTEPAAESMATSDASLAEIAAAVRARTLALEAQAAGPGKAEFDAILTCIGES
ncbi:MAG: hypothetical protein JNJ63_11235 [Hyphomonadaceae bacterium]|nr:hypothetical protein [Hyphomonadaceae bacterium]